MNQGDWGEWQNNETKCPSGYYVCGMSMKEQGQVIFGDNTAANGIKISCCSKP